MHNRAPILLSLFFLTLAFFFLAPPRAGAQAAPAATAAVTREKIALAGPWHFTGETHGSHAEKPDFDDRAWSSVTVPHTWDSKQAVKTRKAAWYRTHFTLTAADKGREIFLYFEGAAAIADVYLNGVHLGQHRGAYTRFIFDGTAAATGGDNLLAVKCDTDPKDTSDCLPAGNGYQLYHVYGGLYRHVWLLKTAAVHVDPTDYASSGLYLTPQVVNTLEGALGVKTLVRNDGAAPAAVTVTDTVRDADGRTVAAATETLTLAAHAGGASSQRVRLAQPHLWSPADPALYRVTAETSVNGRVTDSVTEQAGFRFFQMTPGGFFLNGARTDLRGVAKHQETEERASAVSDEDLRRDWDDLHELGVNFVRLAHYPHAPLEYDQADEKGIVVWAENGHSQPAMPTVAGDRITTEMVRQNYNHPSICFWSVGNEAVYTAADVFTLEHYAATVRSQDTTRLVTYASNTAFSADPALDFVAVNRYFGWYGGTIETFNSHAAYYHWISETGAGGVVSTHTTAAVPTHRVNAYEPEEYQQELAESRCQAVFRTLTASVPLFTWWTFRDFGDPRYKGVNAKGLETYGAFHKDVYSLFQSFLKPSAPVVHLCGKPWFLRRTDSPFDTLSVKAYSNAPALTLTVNGVDAGVRRNGVYLLADGTRVDNVFFWDAVLRPGRNEVSVDDGAGHTDSAVVYAERGEESGLVRNLTSSNLDNPAYFIGLPVQAEWPLYDDFDGTGDNTFHLIPPVLEGAQWITMGRPSKPEYRTALDFRIAPDAGATDVFLMFSLPAAFPAKVPAKSVPQSKNAPPEAPALPTLPAMPFDFLQGFTDTHIRGIWRDNSLDLVPYALYRRTVQGGDAVHVPDATLGYVVLVKPHAAP